MGKLRGGILPGLASREGWALGRGPRRKESERAEIRLRRLLRWPGAALFQCAKRLYRRRRDASPTTATGAHSPPRRDRPARIPRRPGSRWFRKKSLGTGSAGNEPEESFEPQSRNPSSPVLSPVSRTGLPPLARMARPPPLRALDPPSTSGKRETSLRCICPLSYHRPRRRRAPFFISPSVFLHFKCRAPIYGSRDGSRKEQSKEDCK